MRDKKEIEEKREVLEKRIDYWSDQKGDFADIAYVNYTAEWLALGWVLEEVAGL